jgi:8-oxo-dGTP pyrophosphatase MutT (NUDIX family)
MTPPFTIGSLARAQGYDDRMPRDFENRLKDVLAGHRPARVSVHGARDAAVLIPIVAGDEPTVIFTVRTDTLPSHKGQISFPGGSVDATDATAEAAALREAEEELGLDPRAFRILGELDAVPTFVSGYVILPFVGWTDDPPRLDPNPAEVAEVLEVPVRDLAEDIRRPPGFTHEGRTFPTEAWVWNGHVIWGATARVVRIFLERLAAAGLAPPPGDAPEWPAWPNRPPGDDSWLGEAGAR